jgi:hypothetical protein
VLLLLEVLVVHPRQHHLERPRQQHLASSSNNHNSSSNPHMVALVRQPACLLSVQQHQLQLLVVLAQLAVLQPLVPHQLLPLEVLGLQLLLQLSGQQHLLQPLEPKLPPLPLVALVLAPQQPLVHLPLAPHLPLQPLELPVLVVSLEQLNQQRQVQGLA